MTERHGIYIRRAQGAAKPWTKDQVLQNYRFCNVYRELDTTTQWIRQNTRDEVFSAALCRQINWIPTLQRIYSNNDPRAHGGDGDFSPAMLAHLIEFEKDVSGKAYTSAYMLTAGGASGGMRKSEITASLILAPLWALRDVLTEQITRNNTLQYCTERLSGLYGFGPFIGYEVACDLRYSGMLARATDIMTWANPGPGARRGLNRLFGRPVDTRVSTEACVSEMRFLLKEVSSEWGFAPLEMREIEHSLCEFDKYQRVALGQGTPRQRFNGRA